MRQFIFKVSLCVSLSLLPFAEVQAGSTAGIQVDGVQNTSAPGIKVDMTKVLVGLKEGFNQIMNATGLNAQKAEEQALAGQTASDVHATSVAQAASQNARQGVQQGVFTDILRDSAGLAEGLCQAVSGAKNTEDVQEHSDEMEDAYVDRATKVGNSEAGTDSENGLIDFQRKLFERSLALCSAQGNGGGNEFCTGDGSNKHLTIHTLLGAESLPIGPSIKNDSIEYMDDVLFARVPLSIPPDALEDPKTDVQNLLVESDRLKMEMSVGQQAFSMVRANRVGKTGLNVVDQYKEIMEANGWSSEKISEHFDENGLSVNSMYHALTLGSYGPEFMVNLLSGKGPKGYFAILGQQLMLNNVLQYEQYKLLESIALSSAINIPVNRDDEIKRVNAKIQKVRSGN